MIPAEILAIMAAILSALTFGEARTFCRSTRRVLGVSRGANTALRRRVKTLERKTRDAAEHPVFSKINRAVDPFFPDFGTGALLGVPSVPRVERERCSERDPEPRAGREHRFAGPR